MEVPADTPVTKPVLSTIATAGFEDTHGLTVAAVPDPVNCVVVPIHAVKVPVITGSELTVMVDVTVQPLLFVYVIVEVPTVTPVTKPVLLTVATARFEDNHGLTVAAVAEPVN